MIMIALIKYFSDSDTVKEKRRQMLNVSIPPSQLKPEALPRHQKSDEATRILCSRPPNLEPTMPVTLLHPILNEFNHNCATYEPKGEDYCFAQELSFMSEFFSKEEDRRSFFTTVCSKYGIELGGHSVLGSNYKTDRTIHVKNWPCLVVEIKLEIGSLGAEPMFQVAGYYRAYAQAKKPLQSRFIYPCIGMYVVGEFKTNSCISYICFDWEG
jgi:hypothetical protein